MMKKVVAAIIVLATIGSAKAQDSLKNDSKPPRKLDLSNRANDHLVIQYGVAGWSGNVPDSAKPEGFSRFFNFYFMLDKPFKNDPHFSLGIGAGIGSDNIFFKDKIVNVGGTGSTLAFTDRSATDHFKKFKVTTIYVDVPLEIRYAKHPENPDKGFKASAGIKAGFLLKAYSKGKNYVNSAGQSIYGNGYIRKEFDKKYFNSTRLSAVGRIGLGHISLSGSYQFTSLLKGGAGPEIHPYNIGITLSGL
jgi:hypothetical protein